MRLLLPFTVIVTLTVSAQAQEPQSAGTEPTTEATAAATEPAPASAPAPPAEAKTAEPANTSPTAGYKKGFFIRNEAGTFTTKINGRVQVRHDIEVPDGGDIASEFSIPRARLKMGGKAFVKELGYKLQLDFGKGFFGLKDFYVDYAIDSEWLSIRAGQFKRPFSRQQLNSSSKLSLVDRAITDKAFGAGRDIGLMLHNGFGKKNAVEYAVGLFNGTGDKGRFSGSADAEGGVSGKFSNLPGQFNPMLVMRAGYNYGGMKRYSEGDFEGGDLRFGVGASSQLNFDVADDAAGSVDIGVDASLKVEGFSLDAEFFVGMAQDDADAGFSSQALTGLGLYAQAGYVIAEQYLPVIRYESVMPDGTGNDTQVLTAGFGAFFFKHNLKLQTELSWINAEAGEDASTSDIRVRTQLQLSF
ncbi:MAG: porin [Myxococcota bacterium]